MSESGAGSGNWDGLWNQLHTLDEHDYERAHVLEDSMLWQVCALLEQDRLDEARELAGILQRYAKAHPGRNRPCA